MAWLLHLSVIPFVVIGYLPTKYYIAMFYFAEPADPIALYYKTGFAITLFVSIFILIFLI